MRFWSLLSPVHRGERGGAGRELFLAPLSAALLLLAFPTFGLPAFAWIALVPLLVALREKGPLASFFLCLLFGVIFSMGACNWYLSARGFEVGDLFIFGLYIGLFFALFGLVLGLIGRSNIVHPLAPAPLVWVAMEYLRVNAGLLGFPGLLLGHTQYDTLPVIQVASFTGAYGVSFIILAANAMLAATLSRLRANRSHAHSGGLAAALPLRGGAFTVGLLVLSLGYGLWALEQEPEGKRIPVTVIQGNIPQDIRWDEQMREKHLAKHIALTREAAGRRKAALIVWPETTVQGSLEHDPALNGTMADLARETGTPLLVGSSEAAKFRPEQMNYPNRYNSAFLMSPEGEITGQYKKMHLFPFGEYLPYQGTFPWPMRYLRTANYLPGKEHTVLDLDGRPFSAVICWESMFPGLFRQFVRRGASVVVNITNEAWFGMTAAPTFFLGINVFRAVENRVSLVRASNTGVSCFIDPFGRITARVERDGRDIFVEGYATEDIMVSGNGAFYTRYGDLFAFSCLTATGILLVTTAIRRRAKEEGR